MTRGERRRDEPPPTDERPTNWTLIVLLAALVLLVLVIAYLATRRDSNPDRLTNSEVSTASVPDREKLCSSKSVYDMIKDELFHHAAQIRGSDQAAYDQLANAAVVRMENPVMESEANGTVRCSGSLSIDLPPGIAVADGRRTLMSDVDYGVQVGTGGGASLVSLSNADAIVTPLAKLVRVSEPEANATEDDTNTESSDQSGANLTSPQPAPPAAVQSPAPVTTARPSFDCANARTSGEAAVCSDAGLAALDRAMATQYARALDGASPDERDLLRGTARRFYAFRDRCGDRQCIADAYAGRMREIRDIMEGRWQPR